MLSGALSGVITTAEEAMLSEDDVRLAREELGNEKCHQSACVALDMDW